MIGNFSFEEHDRYFTKMYNHLKCINQNLDITTIINIIKYKVILEQEQENIMHNLNIKNIYDTPMVKDFEIWSAKYNVQSEDGDELRSQDEDEEDETQSEEDETQSEEDESNENDDEEDEIDSDNDELRSQDDDEEDEIDSDNDDEYSDIEYRHNEIPEGF